jgi:hypothetical protein
MPLAQPVDLVAGEAAKEQQAVAGGAGRIHDFCPARGEIQGGRHVQQACDSPSRQFADAIAGDDEPARHFVSQRRGGGLCLQGAENLAGTIAVDGRARIGSHDIAGIPPAEEGGRMRE